MTGATAFARLCYPEHCSLQAVPVRKAADVVKYNDGRGPKWRAIISDLHFVGSTF
jgi:hypothetical protein